MLIVRLTILVQGRFIVVVEGKGAILLAGHERQGGDQSGM